MVTQKKQAPRSPIKITKGSKVEVNSSTGSEQKEAMPTLIDVMQTQNYQLYGLRESLRELSKTLTGYDGAYTDNEVENIKPVYNLINELVGMNEYRQELIDDLYKFSDHISAVVHSNLIPTK